MNRLFLSALFLCMLSASAFAGVDDYPTSIAGCYHTDTKGNKVGPPFTGDLKDAAQDSLIDPWNEYNRECTSFAAFRLSSRNGFTMPFNDFAKGWGTKAQSLGYTVNSTPGLGAIAWWSETAIPPYGHVAWVESINGTAVTVEDYNWDIKHNPGTHGERLISSMPAVTNYIHFKDIQTSSSTDIYVSTGGNNNNNGSSGSPYRDVTYAVSQASATAPVTIHVAPGNYPGNFNTGQKKITFVTWGTGTVNIGGEARASILPIHAPLSCNAPADKFQPGAY